MTYTVTGANDGNETLHSVVVTDPRCTLALGSGDANANGLLDVGETWSYSCVYRVTQADIDAGTIANTATVTADNPSGGLVTNSGSTTVTAPGNPHMTVTKSAFVPSVTAAGESISNSVTVANDSAAAF